MISVRFAICLLSVNQIYTEHCKTNITGFKENKDFNISSESNGQKNSYQIILNEVFCMPNNITDFCIEREYSITLENTKSDYNCPLIGLLPLTVTRMKIEKTARDINVTAIMVNTHPPEILVEKLQKLIVEAEINKTTTAGFWKVDQDCWARHNRSLKECGTSLILHHNLTRHPSLSAMELHKWILEPIRSLGGTLTKLNMEFNPYFWLPMAELLVNECCYLEMRIVGIGWGNVTIHNQPRLTSLYVKGAFKDSLKVNFTNASKITSLVLPETWMSELPSSLNLLKDLTVLDVSSNNLTTLPSNMLTTNKLKVLNVSDNNLQTLPFSVIQLENLKVLEMSNNKIGTVHNISKLENLEELDLSHNSIQYMSEKMSALKKLNKLDLSYNIDLSTFPYSTEYEPYISLRILKLSHTGYVMNNGIDILEKLNDLTYLDLSGNGRFSWADNPFRFLRGKHRLSFLNMSAIDMSKTGILGRILPDYERNVEHLSNLQLLDLSHCNIPEVIKMIFVIFPSLEFLDLSYNEIKTVPSNLTLGLEHIKVINISNNFIESISLELTPQSVVELVDLSYNWITNIENIIRLGSVKTLDLSSNRISRWYDSNIFSKPTTWVQNLSLSFNKIDFLTQNMRKSLEDLTSVDLGGNPVNCQLCRTIGLQKWLLNGGQKNIQNFTCQRPNNVSGLLVTSVPMSEKECIPLLRNESSTPLVYTVILPATFITLLLLVGGTAIYRYRLHIAYILHMFNVRRKCKEVNSNIEKEYDAFVCYSGLDTTWVCNELCPNLEGGPEKYKLCIHERDFPVGTFITRNIDKAIKSSKHTIVILSNKFLASAWCRWELELTNYTMFDEDRDLIIMIELEQLDQQKIPRYLKFLMNTRTYLQWPRSNSVHQTSNDLAWKRLKTALGESLYQKNSGLTIATTTTSNTIMTSV